MTVEQYRNGAWLCWQFERRIGEVRGGEEEDEGGDGLIEEPEPGLGGGDRKSKVKIRRHGRKVKEGENCRRFAGGRRPRRRGGAAGQDGGALHGNHLREGQGN